jgi:hypothetical protein
MPPKKYPPGTRWWTVKACLSKHLRVKRLTPEINRWVFHLSKLYHRGASFFHLHLLRLLENQLPLPTFNQSFFYQCFTMGMNDPDKPDPQLLDSWNQFHPTFPPLERITGDPQAINYLAKKYVTNFENHIKMNFFGRQFKLLTNICPNKTMAFQIQSMLNQKKPWDESILRQLDPINQTWINWARTLVAHLAPNDIINDYWVAKHLNLALIYIHVIQKVFEQIGVSNFSITPVVDIRSHFITIDTKVLYHLTKNLGLHTEKNLTAFEENRTTYWHQFFKIEWLGNEAYFENYVETDGVAISIHFVKSPQPNDSSNSTTPTGPPLSHPNFPPPKSSHVLERDTHLTGRRVLGNDPGRTNLAYIVEPGPNNTLKTYVLTKGQYYQESHINRAKRKSDQWTEEIQDLADQLNGTNHLTPRGSEVLRYLQALNQGLDRRWAHLTQKKYARNRMDVNIHKHQCVDRFFQSLIKDNPERPVIAYGDAKFKSTGRGEIAAPTTFMYQKCLQHYDTMYVPEHKTTQLCHKCEQPMTLLYHDHHDRIKMSRKKGRSYTEIRGLRWCSSTKCRSLRNRDENAARNILKIAKTEGDLTNFSRKPSNSGPNPKSQGTPEGRVPNVTSEEGKVGADVSVKKPAKVSF